MTQGTVLQFLTKEKKAKTTKEIAKALNLSRSSVAFSLRRLIRSGDITRMKPRRENSFHLEYYYEVKNE